MQAKRGTELSATGAVFAGSLGACAWTIASMIIVSRAVSAVNEAGDGGASLDDAVDVDVLRAHELTSIFQASFGSMLFGALIFLYPWPEFGRVAELMKKIQGDLARSKLGEPTRRDQDEVVRKLDELIDQLGKG